MSDSVAGKKFPFPRVTSSQMLAMRTMKTHRTLNDLVEEVHLRLMDDEERSVDYNRFLDATVDTEAIEGTTRDDDHEAARMIREKAGEMHYTEVAKLKIASIRKILNYVLRRYDISRKQRRLGFGNPLATAKSTKPATEATEAVETEADAAE